MANPIVNRKDGYFKTQKLATVLTSYYYNI